MNYKRESTHFDSLTIQHEIQSQFSQLICNIGENYYLLYLLTFGNDSEVELFLCSRYGMH